MEIIFEYKGVNYQAQYTILGSRFSPAHSDLVHKNIRVNYISPYLELYLAGRLIKNELIKPLV